MAIDKRPEVSITLDFPVEVDGLEYKTLTIRRPKVKDGKRAAASQGTAAETGILMMSILCNVPPEVIEELDMADQAKLEEVFTSFQGGPRVGA